jgi:hypothetical protein
MNRISSWLSTCRLFLKTHPDIFDLLIVGRFLMFLVLSGHWLWVLRLMLASENLVDTGILFAQSVAITFILIQFIQDDIPIRNTVLRVFIAGVLAEGLKIGAANPFFVVEVAGYVQAHTTNVLMGIFAGVASWLVFRLTIPTPSDAQCAYGLRKAHSEFFKRIGPWTKLRLWDAEMVSAHEAGHAVVLGLLPFHQKNLEVVMTSDKSNGIDGFCRINGWKNLSHSMVFLELDMISFLAGVEAEKICTGERTISGTSDYDRFIEIAEQYLACGEFELFYLDPKNELEAAYNRSKILELRLRLQQVVRDLLLENREILESLRQKLMDKGRVHGTELTDLLVQVKPVPGCPIISAFLKEAMRVDVAEANERFDERPVA